MSSAPPHTAMEPGTGLSFSRWGRTAARERADPLGPGDPSNDWRPATPYCCCGCARCCCCCGTPRARSTAEDPPAAPPMWWVGRSLYTYGPEAGDSSLTGAQPAAKQATDLDTAPCALFVLFKGKRLKIAGKPQQQAQFGQGDIGLA